MKPKKGINVREGCQFRFQMRFILISCLVKIRFELAEPETFPVQGGWGAVSSENKAKLPQLGLELGLSLAIYIVTAQPQP